VSDDNDTQYRLRSRERIAVNPSPRPRERAGDSGRPFALGSNPDIAVVPELAVPSHAGVAVAFGTTTVLIEVDGDRVVMTMPGGLRLVGTADEAERLASALRG
jgi:hypothetical protein